MGVEVSIDPAGVATVTLSRPARKNALTPEMLDTLTSTGQALGADPAVRVVVLRGAGGCFSSGMDLQALAGLAMDPVGTAQDMADAQGTLGNRFQRPCRIWQQLPVPVIAVIDGVCFGAAMQLALACDLRIATPDAQLSLREGKWGLVPDMGVTQSLFRLVRADHAKDLIWSARIMSGDEAAQMGLITQIAADPMVAALERARTLCQRSPDAVAAGKRLVEEGWHADARDALALEAELQSALIGSPNQVEAVAAGMAKRAPTWTPRRRAKD